MWSQIRAAVISIVLLTLLTGLAYPLVVWVIAQAVFSHQANGSMVLKNEAPIGSELIGQNFDAPRYFWGRLSATSPMPYNAASSSGSNNGPLNPALFDEVKGRIDALRAADPSIPANTLVPVDLVTSSASGLDPDISPAAAYFQVHRVAQARGLRDEAVNRLVAQHVQDRQLRILGEKRVNVLKLNLALDALPR